MARFKLGRGKRGTSDPASDKPISSQPKGSARLAFGCLGAAFLLFGLLLGWFLLIKPVRGLIAARSWAETPCIIVSSQVGVHSGDDGPTYSIDITYRYVFRGREHTSDRYDFIGGSSSGYDGKAKIVERYPEGSSAVCWVDPDDPTESVFDRSFRAKYLLGLIPLVMLLIGLGAAYAAIKIGRKRAVSMPAPTAPGAAEESWTLPMGGSGGSGSSGASGAASGMAAATGTAAPATLEPTMSPIGKLVAIILIAAFWNGITGVFVWQVVAGWRAGEPDGCLTLFITPFVLVGLLLLSGVPYQMLALFNPRPRLTLDPGVLVAGEESVLTWSFKGAVRRIQKLTLTLEAREEATYQRGTDTHTDKRVFFSREVLTSESSLEIAGGSLRLALPAGAMHGFEAPHNKILWRLKLQGEIARWPDVSEEMPLTVPPPSPDSLPDWRPDESAPPEAPRRGPAADSPWTPPPAPLPDPEGGE